MQVSIPLQMVFERKIETETKITCCSVDVNVCDDLTTAEVSQT